MLHTSAKDGKVCEVIDFGTGQGVEVCAGTMANLELVRKAAATGRKAALAK